MVDGLGSDDRFHQGGTASHSVIFSIPSGKLARALVFKVLKFDPFNEWLRFLQECHRGQSLHI
jgi:hypothetical protein